MHLFRSLLLFGFLYVFAGTSSLIAQLRSPEIYRGDIEPDTFYVTGNELTWNYGYDVVYQRFKKSEFIIIMQMDTVGVVSEVITVAFTGERHLVTEFEKMANRFVGKTFAVPPGTELERYYVVPVVIRQKGSDFSDVSAQFASYMESLSQGDRTGVFDPLVISWKPVIGCFRIRRDPRPPWVKSKDENGTGRTLTSEQIKALPSRKN